MSSSPLPLPKEPDPVWDALRVYLLAFLYLLPSVFVTSFAGAFIMPRLKQIWEEAGLSSSKAAWMMDWVERMSPFFVFFAAGFILLVCVCELTWSNWRGFRRSIVTSFMLVIHTAVLVWITAVAVTSLLAAPMFAQKKVKEAKASGTEQHGSSDHP